MAPNHADGLQLPASYTEGISVTQDDVHVKADLLAKRAGINLVLAKFDAAKEDALASVTGGSNDWKAYHTAGRASYGLRDYQASRDYHQRALELSADNQSIKREVERCANRVAEAKLGEYDFQKMAESVTYRNVHLDHASFTRKVYVADSAVHGQGLFAKEPIKAGELVFCERAFLLPNQYEPTRAAATLFATMTSQLYNNPSQAAQILSLDAGDYARSGSEGTVVDGVPVTDIFLVESIRRRNCFSAPLTTQEETRTRPTAANGPRQTKGLWTHASRMNHSCVPNTSRSFVGDMLAARAVRDIAAGEELSQAYTSVKAQYGRRQAAFQGWGFTCACALCAGEARSTAEEEKKARVLGEVEKLAKKKPPTGFMPDAVIRSMEKLARELEELHRPDVYDGLPRLMLIYPTMWLLEAYKGRKNHAKVAAAACNVLRNFGYEVRGDGEGEEGSRSVFGGGGRMPAVLTIHVVTVLRDAAAAYRSMGKGAMADRCDEAAKCGYLLVTGLEADQLL